MGDGWASSPPHRKRDHLAAAELVERWRERNESLRRVLAEMAAANRWETAPDRALGVARALYLPLDVGALLWMPPDSYVSAEPARLRQALAA